MPRSKCQRAPSLVGFASSLVRYGRHFYCSYGRAPVAFSGSVRSQPGRLPSLLTRLSTARCTYGPGDCRRSYPTRFLRLGALTARATAVSLNRLAFHARCAHGRATAVAFNGWAATAPSLPQLGPFLRRGALTTRRLCQSRTYRSSHLRRILCARRSHPGRTWLAALLLRSLR
jgi:hypothetical protein